MIYEAILNEVDQLHSVSARLEGLAEMHPPVSEPLLKVAGSVRNTATLLAVLVATKGNGNKAGLSTPEAPPTKKNPTTN